jgi:hypothetical protein
VLAGCIQLPQFPRLDRAEYATQHQFSAGAAFASPQGYCIARKLIKEKDGVGFLVTTPCPTVEGFDEVGLITLTVAPADPIGLKGADELLRAAAPSGGFKVIKKSPNMVLARISPQKAQSIASAQRDFWQGLGLRGGYISVATLYVPKGVTFSDKMAADILRDTLTAVSAPQTAQSQQALNTGQRPQVRPKVFSVLRPKARPTS